jgi:hypothetical protein
MKTDKVTFDDGSWWEFRLELTVGMVKAFNDTVRPYRKSAGPVGTPEEILSGKAKAPEFSLDLQSLDFDAVNRALVFAATKSWSYGPVTEQVFTDEVPHVHYAEVLERLQKMLLPLLGVAPKS